MLFLFAGLLLSLFVYSYALIDPNLTLINHPLWVVFRDPLVYFGYYQRQASTVIFIILLLLLFLFHWYFTNNYKRFSLWKIIGIISVFSIISYPFLSHDFFNYIFDAKILTFYGKNPYELMPGFFYQDEWLRFMHWTHRSYPYGPAFLPITLIPSYLGMNIFILNFLLFKAMFIGFYLAAVYFLQKLDRRAAIVFATQPLVLLEGLINTHNDIIAVALGIIGIYLIWEKKQILGRVIFLLSVGIKYLSAPILIVKKNHRVFNIVSLIGQIALILYLCLSRETQPWYFLSLFIYLPLYPRLIDDIQIFFFGLLLSYYPYVRFGDWNIEKLDMKHDIIVFFTVLNVIYLIIKYRSYIFRYLRIK